MTCINPIKAWKKRWSSLIDSPQKYYKDKKLKFKKPKDIENYDEIKVACGNCIGCKLDHANMWATRITLETKENKENCFITLTYNNENLPLTKTNKMTLRKKDFQNFMKRLREKINIKIGYFACGEYGNQTHRPHYHLCLFGWIPKDIEKIRNSLTNNPMFTSKELEKIWGNGYVVIQELNYKTACYTARYVQKKAGIQKNKRILTNEITEEIKIDERTKKPFIRFKNKYISEKTDQYGREKEFILMSKKPAIGKNYWLKNKNNIALNEGILLKLDGNVKKKPIPRYYKKLWEKEAMSEYDTFQYHAKEKAKKQYIENVEKFTGKDPEKTMLETIKNNLLNRTKFLKREQN